MTHALIRWYYTLTFAPIALVSTLVVVDQIDVQIVLAWKVMLPLSAVTMVATIIRFGQVALLLGRQSLDRWPLYNALFCFCTSTLLAVLFAIAAFRPMYCYETF